MLRFIVNGQTLTRVDKFNPATDSEGYLQARFEFSADWAGTAKVALFRDDITGKAYRSTLDGSGVCNVPSEVLAAVTSARRNYFMASVYGVANDIPRVTTNELRIDLKPSGFGPASTPADPTPDVYEQILAAYSETLAECQGHTAAVNAVIGRELLSVNLFDRSVLTEGYYVKAQDPLDIRENSATGYYKSEDLEPGSTYVISGDGAHILVSCSDIDGANVLHQEVTDGGTFTIPATAENVYISAWLSCADVLQIEEGRAATDYAGYNRVNVFKGFLEGQPLVVDASGAGMFKTLTDAVAAARDGSTILVMPGVYEGEIVKAWGKTVHIIGVSKKDCVIKNDTGDYYSPPMEFSSGTLRNLTILHEYNAANNPDTKGYAIHVEDDGMIGKNLLVENCYIESQWNFALGMGMRAGCHVEFNNCDFVGTDGVYRGGTHGGLFFHDCNNDRGIGEQNLVVKNCGIFSKCAGGVTVDLKIQSQEKEGTTVNVEFVGCNVRNLTTGAQNVTMLNSGETAVDAVEELTNFHLSYGSFGNSAAVLNH